MVVQCMITVLVAVQQNLDSFQPFLPLPSSLSRSTPFALSFPAFNGTAGGERKKRMRDGQLGERERERERETDRQTDRQTDRETDRQTGRQTDRQTDSKTDRGGGGGGGVES